MPRCLARVISSFALVAFLAACADQPAATEDVVLQNAEPVVVESPNPTSTAEGALLGVGFILGIALALI